MSDREARQITRDEARILFVRHLIGVMKYWLNESRADTTEEKMAGFLFSTLVTLDGGSCGSPGYHVVPVNGPDGKPSYKVIPVGQECDTEYSIDEGIDYYPTFEGELPEGVYDIAGGLHEILGKVEQGELKVPDDLFDFGAKMAEEARKYHAGNEPEGNGQGS